MAIIRCPNCKQEISLDSYLLCRNCVHYSFMQDGMCTSVWVPLKDFVNGKRICSEINTDGTCKYFKEK